MSYLAAQGNLGLFCFYILFKAVFVFAFIQTIKRIAVRAVEKPLICIAIVIFGQHIRNMNKLRRFSLMMDKGLQMGHIKLVLEVVQPE